MNLSYRDRSAFLRVEARVNTVALASSLTCRLLPPFDVEVVAMRNSAQYRWYGIVVIEDRVRNWLTHTLASAWQ